MRKFLFIIVLIFLLSPYALFALASPVNLQLNTTIPAVSTLQVNGGTGTATFIPWNPSPISYTYYGNQLVRCKSLLLMDSTFGIRFMKPTTHG